MAEAAKKPDPQANFPKPIPTPIPLKRSKKYPNNKLLWGGLAFMIVCVLVLVFLLVFCLYHPKNPKFSVISLHFDAFKKVGNDQYLAPSLDITMRVDLPKKAKIYTHQRYIGAKVAYPDIQLWSGVLPVVEDPSYLRTTLQGSTVSQESYAAIYEKQQRRKIPLKVEMTLSVKYNIWYSRSKTRNLDVHCFVVVDELSSSANILYNRCHTG